MTDRLQLPEGLKVERTASGGFRFELPRPKWAWVVALIGIPFMCGFIAAGLGFLREFVSDAPWPFALFGVVFMIFWTAGPLLAIVHIVKIAFGRHALEVSERELVLCLHLPPLPESRRRIPLSKVTAVTVESSRGRRRHGDHCMSVKAGRRTYRVGIGLERPALEWLAARTAALAAHGGAQGEGGKGLMAVFEADRRRDRLMAAAEGGEVASPPEEVEIGPPPEGSGITVVDEGRGRLALQLKARGGGFFLFFAAVWLGFITLFTLVAAFADMKDSGGDVAPKWMIALFLLPFWAVGIGMLLAGLRQRTLVERIEVRDGEVSWQARSVLGARQKTLRGRGMGLSRHESYRQNEQPVYHLRITCPGEKPIKFAGNVKPEGQAWLVARLARELSVPGALSPGKALDPGPRADQVAESDLRAPPRGTGISITQERRDFLALHLAGRGGRGMIGFSAVWLLFTGGIGAAIFFIEGPGGGPLLFVYVVLGIFALIGVATLATGLKHLTLVEDIEVRPGEVSWRALSILGPRRRKLLGEEIEIVSKESYKQNNRVVYHLRLTCQGHKPIRFAGNIKPRGQAWLMAKVTRALEGR